MEVKEYSNNVCKNTKKSRIGCSVCQKKNFDVKLVDNYSSNKPWLNRKCLISNITNTKFKNVEKSEISPNLALKPLIKECYCNNMEKIKIEIFPRLICSKSFKTPNLIDVDKDWLHDIVEFRRENWFDCHTNLFFDANSLQNINPLCEYILCGMRIFNFIHL